MNDSHINSQLYDEKLYFKSIETNMHKQKSPIAETRHSFKKFLQLQESTDDSLYKESIMEIPETNEDMEQMKMNKKFLKNTSTHEIMSA